MPRKETLYDWHARPKGHRPYGFTHAKTALDNAERDFQINPIEAEMIRCHMFPMNILRIPHHRESIILCLADKTVASKEISKRQGIRMPLPFFFCSVQLRLFLHQKCHFGAGGIGSCFKSALMTRRCVKQQHTIAAQIITGIIHFMFYSSFLSVHKLFDLLAFLVEDTAAVMVFQ